MPPKLPLLRPLSNGVAPLFEKQMAPCCWNSTSARPVPRAPIMDKRLKFARNRMEKLRKFEENQMMVEKGKQLEKNQTRPWKPGDVYAPHDLSPAEMKKWKQRKSPSTDAFDALSINPLHQYKNFSIMSEYMSEMGRIRHSSETGLRNVNQRKIAKAIRRAIGLGLMPSVHRHPEVLALEQLSRVQRGWAA
ncbi:hypothetical protein FQN54_000974 [Arachnomyces sp. PD_36]|nr:hypothetical protein FQN54_000974 [Arachnomyces sp. PD_36]